MTGPSSTCSRLVGWLEPPPGDFVRPQAQLARPGKLELLQITMDRTDFHFKPDFLQTHTWSPSSTFDDLGREQGPRVVVSAV